MLNNRTPYEVLFNRKTTYEFFKAFGCACYPLLRPYNHHKFEYHASICLFLGYDSKHKGYLCLLSSGKTIISRHVIFNETVFPFSLTNNPFSIGSNLSPSTHSNVPLTVITSPTSLPSAPNNNYAPNNNSASINNYAPINNYVAPTCTTAPISCESMESLLMGLFIATKHTL